MRRVTQKEAKRGECIDTYETKESFDLACKRMEVAAKRGKTKRELVYTTVPIGRKIMWQVFLMP
jgi:hypothetical protein